MKDDALKEQVSALLDDELLREEQSLLLRRLASTPELAAQLGRYALVREAMRRNTPEVVDVRLAERVAIRLQAEPALNVARRPVRQRWLRPIAGMAVAGSVAMVSLLVWPTAEEADSSRIVPQVADTTLSPQPPSALPVADVRQVATGTSAADEQKWDRLDQWDRLDPYLQERLSDYLVNHSEHTPIARFGGMLNYVRITSHADE